jgi:(p)ppGpp synthase/HD superfamily hydrolase
MFCGPGESGNANVLGEIPADSHKSHNVTNGAHTVGYPLVRIGADLFGDQICGYINQGGTQVSSHIQSCHLSAPFLNFATQFDL